MPGSCYSYDRHGILVCTASLDGAVQTVVSNSLRPPLFLAHYPKLTGHPSKRRMYDTMRRELCRPHMGRKVYRTLGYCCKWARNRISLKEKRPLKLFSANGPLQFLVMDILSLLPKTATGNQFVMAITNRYTKLTRAIPSSKTTETHGASIFLDHFIVSYGIPGFFLTDNCPPFVRKFFETFCTFHG